VLVDTFEGRLLLNDDGTEFVPAGDSWNGRVLRRFPDGTMILAGREGIVRRDLQSGRREVLVAMGPSSEVIP
jgi:hypothetical protein